MLEPALRRLLNKEALTSWMNEVIPHCMRVEFFTNKLEIKSMDWDRPHDIVGKGNKFEDETIYGFALQYTNSFSFIDRWIRNRRIQEAIDRHRECQYHHQMWNPPHPYATDEDMKLGAVDAICSMQERRGYKLAFTPQQIVTAIWENTNFRKWFWLKEMYQKMGEVYCPNFSLVNISNVERHYLAKINLPKETHQTIVTRVEETLEMLKGEGYNLKS